MKHTPGPWAIGYSDGSGSEYIISSRESQRISVAALRWGCSCCKDHIDNFSDLSKEEQANAHLIAAAPEMLEALENLENDNGLAMPKSAWDMVQNAIKKAKGEL